MKIGIVQLDQEWENPENNIVRINQLVESSFKNEKVLIFPEMTITGFTMKSSEFAEEINGVATKFFIHLSSKYKTHIFAGIIEKDGDKIFNSLVHFDEHGLITARYRKIHPFSFTKEDKHYSAGDETVITKIEKTKIGLSICYDLRFPELYRFYYKNETDIMINIANWPVPRIKHWYHLLRARAIENQCFMIGVNRTGKDPYHEYDGHSAVFNPMGEEIVSLNDKEQFLSVEINPGESKKVRDELPFAQDVRLI